MILTGRAVEHAERFEEIDKIVLAACPDMIEELTEDEQIDLFNIIMMFERDKNFQNFMQGCLSLYIIGATKGEESIKKLMAKMQEVTKCL